MSVNSRRRIAAAAADPPQRRSLLVGAASLGASVLAVKALPGAAPQPAVAETPPAGAETAGGYRLTDHVLRYYQTARS